MNFHDIHVRKEPSLSESLTRIDVGGKFPYRVRAANVNIRRFLRRGPPMLSRINMLFVPSFRIFVDGESCMFEAMTGTPCITVIVLLS